MKKIQSRNNLRFNSFTNLIQTSRPTRSNSKFSQIFLENPSLEYIHRILFRPVFKKTRERNRSPTLLINPFERNNSTSPPPPHLRTICVSRHLWSFLRRSRGETSVKLEFSLGIKNRFPIFRIPETFARMGRHLNSQRKADRSLPSTFPEETVNELERRWLRNRKTLIEAFFEPEVYR